MIVKMNTPWVRKSSAIALLVLLLVSIWNLLGQPLIAHFSARKDMVIFEHARYQNLAVRRPDLVALQRQREIAGKSASHESTLFSERNEQLAAATLQTRIKNLLIEHGASLDRAAVDKVKEENGLRRIGLEFTTSLSEKKLRPILEALETQEPFLFISYARLRAKPTQNSNLMDLTLDVEMRVHGYMKHQR